MSPRRDYSRQARMYDATRAPSPSVLGPLRQALRGAPGRRLADVGGGTGNYSAALALAEARRILRPGGWLALMVFAHEDVTAIWLTDYVPSTCAWMLEPRQTLADLLALLPGARRIEVV